MRCSASPASASRKNSATKSWRCFAPCAAISSATTRPHNGPKQDNQTMNADRKISVGSSDAASGAPPREKKGLRRILMVFVPLVLLAAGAAAYLWGGRFVSTDNAYIK